MYESASPWIMIGMIVWPSRSPARGPAIYDLICISVIGLCTSGSPGPTVGKNIGLGYLPADRAEVGQTFKVDCRGKLVDAVVVKTPFYKRP